jgi:hypothetical protein
MNFMVYRTGGNSCSVCSSLTLEETLKILNEQHPTMLDHGWIFKEASPFVDGHSNPAPCYSHPKTHKHYLFET